MKKIALALIFCFGIFVSTQAQSVFLEKGQSGFGISGGLTTNEDVSGFSGSVGYSFFGVFDLGINIGRYSFDELFLGDDLNATTITPFASILVIKQDEKIPVSFALNGSYQRQIFSNSVLSDNNIDMTGNFFTVGASLFSMFNVSEAMKIQPGIGFDYITGELKLEDSTDSFTESDNSTFFSLGLSLIFQTSPSTTFVVTPSLGFGEEVTTFGISLGLIFPRN